MPTGFTYISYQAAVTTQIPTIASDPNFQTILPAAIDYAELSIYRDLDFLALHGLVSIGSGSVGQNMLSIDLGIVVLESLLYGPNNAPLVPASQDYIRAAYAGSPNGPPECFAVIGGAVQGGGHGGPTTWTPGIQILLGPAPDQAYAFTAYATRRQQPLSASNSTTFISQNLPDLFWAASMIFFAGYNRNFGAQSDDPRQAMSWSEEYRRVLAGADKEEVRKKFLAQEATAKIPQMRADARPQGQPQ